MFNFNFTEKSTSKNLDNIFDVIKHVECSWTAGPWIVGGCPRALYEQRLDEVNDIDVWFSNLDQLNQVRTRFEKEYGFYTMHESDNATTLSNDVGFKLQLIKKKWYRTPEEIFADYDFTCCQVATTNGRDFHFSSYAKQDLADRRLRVHKFNKESFLARYAKYRAYGFVMPFEELGQYLKQQPNREFNGQDLDY